jgi:hypothetical protein
MHQLFLTTVVPRMEYTLPVWYKPVYSNDDVRRSGTVWIAKALGKVQRQATRLITGALRTTATDTLDFHSHLLSSRSEPGNGPRPRPSLKLGFVWLANQGRSAFQK